MRRLRTFFFSFSFFFILTLLLLRVAGVEKWRSWAVFSLYANFCPCYATTLHKRNAARNVDNTPLMYFFTWAFIKTEIILTVRSFHSILEFGYKWVIRVFCVKSNRKRQAKKNR